MAQIVSIHSFRGGTGKSNSTANLASQMALRGKRVGVIDTDIQSPGIHVLFGLDPNKMGHTLNEYLRGECTIEEAVYAVGEAEQTVEGRTQLVGTDLFLLPSSMSGTEISAVLRDGYDVNKLIKGLRDFRINFELDYLFIDTHPGLNDETLLSISISDVLILLMRPDQQDFQGTSVTVEIARQLDVPDMFIAINKALEKYDFKALAEDIESVYRVPVAGIMPFTSDIVEVASGDIFSLIYPDHGWSKGIISVTETLLGLEE